MSSTEVGRANQAGINRGMRNAQEAVSFLQTAESGLAAIEEIYIRLREIAVAASGNDLTVSERAIMETEFQDTRLDAIRIIDVTAYGDQLLLNGTGGSDGDGEFTFQVGFQSEASAQTTVQIEDQFDPTFHGGTGVKSVGHARDAIDKVDAALNGPGGLHESRAKLGSSITTLNTRISFLMEQNTNFSAAIGERRDLDLAHESGVLSREQVLQNAGVAMLSQANAQSSIALRLLG